MKHEKITPVGEAGPHKEPFTEILGLLERAARNGTRAHLDVHHVQALITSPVFMVLSELKQKEISEKWQVGEKVEVVASSSGITGCGIAPIETIGRSVGWTDGPLAAEVSALAAAQRMIHQRPLKKR